MKFTIYTRQAAPHAWSSKTGLCPEKEGYMLGATMDQVIYTKFTKRINRKRRDGINIYGALSETTGRSLTKEV